MSGPHQFRLLTLHFGLYQLSVSMAGGFAGAYLLKLGFSLPQTLVAYAAILAVRFMLRFLSLALVRRIGFRAAIVLGACVVAAQFLPLAHADRPAGLIAWLLAVALGESLYWPVYHAAVAVTGADAGRGRELGLRTAIGAAVGVAGPLIGGFLLEHFGASADFGLATLITLASTLPVLVMHRIAAGEVPRLADSLTGVDRGAVLAFAADGWMSAGLMLAWPLVLFVSLDQRYGMFGFANAAAGLMGAVTGWVAGHSIDRGRRDRSLVIVSWALFAGFVVRASSSWYPPAATIANMTGAAILGVYMPVLMSVIYDRAKLSGAAYRFHFAAEAGWDTGAVLGCLSCAAAAWFSDVPSLATAPGAAGIWVIYRCVRGQAAHAMDVAGVAEAATDRETGLTS